MKHRNLFIAALADLARRPVRSLVMTGCLVAILFPAVTALGIREALRFQAEVSVMEGADAYVSEERQGLPGPIRESASAAVTRTDGVWRATRRVVGRAYMMDSVIAVVGLEPDGLRLLEPLVRGAVPQARGEALVGHGIAGRFRVKRGLQFTLPASPAKVFKATGILEPSCLWASEVLVMHIDDANQFFGMQGWASQLLLSARVGERSKPFDAVGTEIITAEGDRIKLRIVDRQEGSSMLRDAYHGSSGIFSVLLLSAMVLAIPGLIITSGAGHRELRQEMGLMRAMGWRITDILEKLVLENLVLSIAATCVAILWSMAWIKGLNGVFIAQFFVAEVGLIPDVDIPLRVLPWHCCLSLGFALVVTQAGGTISLITGMVRSPCEAMK